MTDRLSPVTRRMGNYARAIRLEGAAGATFERVAGPPLKKEIQTAAVAAFGPDLKPWTGRGPKATFGYDLTRGKRGARLEFKLRGGAWPYGEHGALPHLIGGGKNYARVNRSTKRPTSSSRRRYVLAAGYKHPVQAPIYHPGTPGKKAIRYAFKRVRRAQADAVRAGVLAALKEADRG